MLRLMDIQSFYWQTFFSTSHKRDGVPAEGVGVQMSHLLLFDPIGRPEICLSLVWTEQYRMWCLHLHKPQYYAGTFLVFIHVSCSNIKQIMKDILDKKVVIFTLHLHKNRWLVKFESSWVEVLSCRLLVECGEFIINPDWGLLAITHRSAVVHTNKVRLPSNGTYSGHVGVGTLKGSLLKKRGEKITETQTSFP